MRHGAQDNGEGGMSNGAMPIQPKFNVTVTAKIGYGDRQRMDMGWQQARTLQVKGVPAWSEQDAQAKVLAKMGTGWKLA